MLDIKDLIVEHGSMRALFGVSLNVKQGERVALLGANGAGKSTTLGAIAGIYPPRSGSIRFKDQEIARRPAAANVIDGIAMVPEGRRLFTGMTVQENLELGAYAPKLRKGVNERLEEIYAMFPILKEKRHQVSGELSGGQQQMVAIGRALMSQPSLLLLDEPFLGIAPVVVHQVMEALRQIAAGGVTVLLVEQNVHRAFEFADRGYVIEHGHVIMEGNARDILDDPDFSAKFLGLEQIENQT